MGRRLDTGTSNWSGDYFVTTGGKIELWYCVMWTTLTKDKLLSFFYYRCGTDSQQYRGRANIAEPIEGGL